jgi:hypothetical protein
MGRLKVGKSARLFSVWNDDDDTDADADDRAGGNSSGWVG